MSSHVVDSEESLFDFLHRFWRVLDVVHRFRSDVCALVSTLPTVHSSCMLQSEPYQVTLFAGALLIAVPVSVFYRYNREKLSIYWRDGLTKKVPPIPTNFPPPLFHFFNVHPSFSSRYLNSTTRTGLSMSWRH